MRGSDTGSVAQARERLVSEAFVTLADTLVDDFDVVELLDRLVGYCVRLLAAEAAGLQLADATGTLRVMASSDERSDAIEMLQTQAEEGPCLDCYRNGEAVSVPDLQQAADRWPRLVEALGTDQYRSAHALPLRLRGRTIGALNLFHREPGLLPAEDLALGQALADVATIGILSERALRSSELLTRQLQGALTSRVIIEQAKGVLAQRGTLTMDTAFEHLRGYARSHNLRLTDLAREVVEGDAPVDAILSGTAHGNAGREVHG